MSGRNEENKNLRIVSAPEEIKTKHHLNISHGVTTASIELKCKYY
jgi:hypothetical protein